MPQMAKNIRPIPAAFVCKCNTIIRSEYYYRIRGENGAELDGIRSVAITFYWLRISLIFFVPVESSHFTLHLLIFALS